MYSYTDPHIHSLPEGIKEQNPQPGNHILPCAPPDEDHCCQVGHHTSPGTGEAAGICRKRPGFTLPWPMTGPVARATRGSSLSLGFSFCLDFQRSDAWGVRESWWQGPQGCNDRDTAGGHSARRSPALTFLSQEPPDPGTDSLVSSAPPPPTTEHYNPPRNGISFSSLAKREVELPAPRSQPRT